MSAAGPIPSTLSDVLRYVVQLYVRERINAGAAWTLGTTYAAGDQVASDGRVYTCFAPGVAAEAPTGPGSQTDSAGVGWFPLFFEGERHDGSEGAPPRIMFLQTAGGTGSALGPVLHIGGGELGSITESCTCYVWGRETAADADRYDDAKARVMRLYAAFNAAAVGRLELRRLERGDQTRLVTFGEQYQMEIGYVWAVPRDAAIDAAAEALAVAGVIGDSPVNPDRPNGPTGLLFNVDVTVENLRT